MEALQGDADAAAAQVARLKDADIRSMWLADLDDFLAAYEVWEEEERASQAQLAMQQKRSKGAAAKKAAGAKKGKKATPWSDDEPDDDEMDWMDDDDEEFKVRMLLVLMCVPPRCFCNELRCRPYGVFAMAYPEKYQIRKSCSIGQGRLQVV